MRTSARSTSNRDLPTAEDRRLFHLDDHKEFGLGLAAGILEVAAQFPFLGIGLWRLVRPAHGLELWGNERPAPEPRSGPGKGSALRGFEWVHCSNGCSLVTRRGAGGRRRQGVGGNELTPRRAKIPDPAQPNTRTIACHARRLCASISSATAKHETLSARALEAGDSAVRGGAARASFKAFERAVPTRGSDDLHY